MRCNAPKELCGRGRERSRRSRYIHKTIKTRESCRKHMCTKINLFMNHSSLSHLTHRFGVFRSLQQLIQHNFFLSFAYRFFSFSIHSRFLLSHAPTIYFFQYEVWRMFCFVIALASGFHALRISKRFVWAVYVEPINLSQMARRAL